MLCNLRFRGVKPLVFTVSEYHQFLDTPEFFTSRIEKHRGKNLHKIWSVESRKSHQNC